MTAGRQELVPGRWLVGTHGPEVRMPSAVAVLLAPLLRTWADQHRHRGVRPKVAEQLEEWVRAVELVAALESDRSVVGADDGPSRAQPDTEVQREVRMGVPSRSAADLLGVSPRQVVRLIDQGQLRASKVGREWLVVPESIDHYRARMAGLSCPEEQQ